MTRASVVGLLVGVLLAGISGCDTGRMGAKNVAGTVVARVDATPKEVTDAAKAVVNEMELIMITSQATTLDGRTVARTAADRKITIDVIAEGENISKVSIRAGVFGDQSLSLKVLKEIQVKLAK